MKYKILKMHFSTAVHFGDNNLSESNNTFSSDVLFSAICIEKVKMGGVVLLNEFVEKIKGGKILFSDAFPYIDNEYYLPKPIMHIDSKRGESDSVKKKSYKKMTYINICDFDKFVSGNFDNPDDTNKLFNRFGKNDILTRASIEENKTTPYQVGIFKYSEISGLYIVVVYEDEKLFDDVFIILKSIGLTGIGGKKSSGLGKFDIKVVDENDSIYNFFNEKLEKKSNKYISLSISLPKDEELESSLNNATYTLVRKGGFADVHYENVAKIKKKEIYLLKSGSCFENKYEGDVYNISFDDDNKIYKYAKPLWIGV